MRFILAVLMTLVVGTLRVHCQLEDLPTFHFLACPADESGGHDEDTPCGEHGCCAAEFAKYQAPRPFAAVPPAQPLVPLECLVPVGLPASKQVVPELLPFPPESPPPWRLFLCRLNPARAPSLVS